MWPVLLIVAMEGIDYIRERDVKREVEDLLDENAQIDPQRRQIEVSHWVLVLKDTAEGRHCLHARDINETGRSSRTIREYYFDPQTASFLTPHCARPSAGRLT